MKLTNLISNLPGLANNLDLNLTSPVGLIEYEDKLLVANADSKVLSYNLSGVLNQIISVPNQGSDISGITLNDSKLFVIEKDNKKAASEWLVNSNLSVHGYNKYVDASTAVQALEIGTGLNGLAQKGNALYLADYNQDALQNSYLVDGQWVPVKNFKAPNIPADYLAFNVAVIKNEVYVMYAQDDSIQVQVGGGYIAVFDLEGNYLRMFASMGQLQSPWAIVRAPKSWKKYRCAFLVGNNLDGNINAYDKHGKFLGKLKDKHGNVIVLDGLYGLTVHDEKLYFVSNPKSNNVTYGLVGYISYKHC